MFALFPELEVLPPETTPLFWLEDCDWPMPWLAELPPAFASTLLCYALFPLFFDFVHSLLHKLNCPRHIAFWLSCDWPMPWLKRLDNYIHGHGSWT